MLPSLMALDYGKSDGVTHLRRTHLYCAHNSPLIIEGSTYAFRTTGTFSLVSLPKDCLEYCEGEGYIYAGVQRGLQ